MREGRAPCQRWPRLYGEYPRALRGGDRLGYGAFLRRIPCEGANAILCSGGLGPKAFRPDRQPALIGPSRVTGPVPAGAGRRRSALSAGNKRRFRKGLAMAGFPF